MFRLIIPIILTLAIIYDGEKLFVPWALEGVEQTVVMSIRLPRTLLAFLVGGTLSMCGLVYQSLFKNDLASPFTLGTAASSSFGACLALYLGLGYLASGFAVAASALNLIVILYILSRNSNLFGHSILLCGVVLSYFFSSLVMLLQVLSNKAELKQIVFWILGDLNTVGLNGVLTALIAATFVCIVFKYYAKDLSLLAVGQTFAKDNGVNVTKIRIGLLVATSITVAIVVAICGPIGFVGVIIPHYVKEFRGARISEIGADTFLCGGIFLVVCEYGAQTILTDYSIPVGIVTSFLGAPFFLSKLLRR